MKKKIIIISYLCFSDTTFTNLRFLFNINLLHKWINVRENCKMKLIKVFDFIQYISKYRR